MPQRRGGRRDPRSLTDDQALERYRYMLRTAPPEAVEQAHEEAFAQLTPQQRAQLLQELSQTMPPQERPRGDDPRSLARAATRAELRQPGYMERTFGGNRGMGMGGGMMGGGMMGGGVGLGGIIGGTILGSIVGNVIGGAVANELFDNDPGFFGIGGEGGGDQLDAGGADTLGAEGDYAGAEALDSGGDYAAADDFGGDLGGDFGDFGGGEL